MTHICVRKMTIIVSDNGLSPGRRQAIIWHKAGILLIGPLGTNLTGILIEIHTFSFKKMHLKMSSGKWRPFRLGLNVLKMPPVWEFLQWLPFDVLHRNCLKNKNKNIFDLKTYLNIRVKNMFETCLSLVQLWLALFTFTYFNPIQRRHIGVKPFQFTAHSIICSKARSDW